MTSAVPLTGLIAGRYRIERLLGHGGMSDVYRAADETGGPPVAVKVVRSTDPELAERLIREARAVAGFDHPNLVRMLQADIQDDHAYLVMELVDGQTLAVRLRKGPLPPDRCATLGAALADALAYVHARGVVHRDVKPANVLLGPGPRVRLADFGIAQVIDASSATVTGTTLGTAAYMAPEQLAHHRVDAAADMWALAAVLLECLTGNRPFEGPAAEVVARRIAGAVPSPEGLPTAWRMLLTSMLDPDPRRRPEAAEVAEMLRAPAFSRPWDPRPTEAFAAGAVAAGAVSGMDGDGASATAVSPPTLARLAPAPLRRMAARHRPPALVGAAIGALLVLVAGLVGWALAGGTPKAQAEHRASTTTVPAPTVTSTSEALVRDVEQGEASGGLAPQVGQTVLGQLGQALSAQAQGDLTAAGNDLGAIDETVTTADAGGSATTGEATTLIADVAALAAAMGLQNPATTTTTTTTTKPPAPKRGGDQGGPGNH